MYLPQSRCNLGNQSVLPCDPRAAGNRTSYGDRRAAANRRSGVILRHRASFCVETDHSSSSSSIRKTREFSAPHQNFFAPISWFWWYVRKAVIDNLQNRGIGAFCKIEGAFCKFAYIRAVVGCPPPWTLRSTPKPPNLPFITPLIPHFVLWWSTAKLNGLVGLAKALGKHSG